MGSGRRMNSNRRILQTRSRINRSGNPLRKNRSLHIVHKLVETDDNTTLIEQRRDLIKNIQERIIIEILNLSKYRDI